MHNLVGMTGFQKRLQHAPAGVLAVVIAGAALAAAPGLAETAEQAARLDTLFTELAEPGRDDWQRVESEIQRIWSQSGSPAMDLLLRRGGEAMEAEDYALAVAHFSALVDHAPEFAEGWNARATAFYYLEEYSLSLSDIEHTLALNPRHFGALEGLTAIFEALDRPGLALDAAEAAIAINPNRPSLQDAVKRLEAETGSTAL